MSDYSTSTTPDETRYQENTPTITPEIVDDEVVDAENLDDIDDGDLVETNPVAALAETFQGTVSKDVPKPYTREEALKATEELKIKLLHALEAQYDLVSAAQEAFDRHIWTALGYPEGAKGWIQYCKDNFTSAQIRVTGQQRTDLIMGFDVAKISNRGIAALLGVDEKTVRNAKTKSGIAPAEGRVRDTAGKEPEAPMAVRVAPAVAAATAAWAVWVDPVGRTRTRASTAHRPVRPSADAIRYRHAAVWP